MRLIPQKRRLHRGEVGADTLLIGIHPGGSSFDKRWPEKQYAELADRLVQQHNATILLLHGPEEAALAHNIQQAMQVSCYRSMLPKRFASWGHCCLVATWSSVTIQVRCTSLQH